MRRPTQILLQMCVSRHRSPPLAGPEQALHTKDGGPDVGGG